MAIKIDEVQLHTAIIMIVIIRSASNNRYLACASPSLSLCLFLPLFLVHLCVCILRKNNVTAY